MRSQQPYSRRSVPDHAGPLWWQAISAGYLRSLARKNRRPTTLATYGFGLRDCGLWLEHEAVVDPGQLTGSHFERWQDVQSTTTKPRTQQVYAAAIRGALKWAALQEPSLVAPTLWLRISTARAGRLIPKPIPQRDLNRLLLALAPIPELRPLREGTSPQENLLERLRTRALFLVILSSGVRISEALSLDRDQLEDRTATVLQKGGHEKVIVISEAAELAVVDYLAARRDSCAALFICHHHEPARFTRSGADDGWNRLCLEARVSRFTNHQLRHSCATELLRQHVDSLIIAAHLGHRGLAHIQNYAEVGLASRREAMEVLDVRIRRAS